VRRNRPVTSHAPVTDDQHTGAGHRLKMTSYSTATSHGDGADNDYYKSWRRHNMTSYDDVDSSSPAAAGVCQHDDVDRRNYVEHIYESPKFDRRHDDYQAARR